MRKGKSPSRAAVIVVLAVVVAVIGLFLSQSSAVTRYFLIGSPLFELHDAAALTGSRLGQIDVHKGHHYMFALQAESADQFTLGFTWQDGTGSKTLRSIPGFDRDVYGIDAVIKADRDDPAAQITLAGLPGSDPQELHLHSLGIFELSGWFYVWRTVVRVGVLIAALTPGSFMARLLYCRLSATRARHDPSYSTAPGTRIVACWAALLLTTASVFGVFLLEDQHSHLFRLPQRSSIYGWDESFYYFWLRSAVVNGDVDFAKDLTYCNSMPGELREVALRGLPKTAKGLIPNKYPIGWALLEAPWYMAADLTARLINVFGGDERRDGWRPLYQVFFIAGQVVYTLLGLWFSYRILKESLPPDLAICGVASGWMCSSLFYYQTLDPGMSHNVVFFAVTGAYYFTYRLRENPALVRNWILIGLLCACAILARYQGAVMLLFPGVVCLQEVARNYHRWTGLLGGVVAGALPLALQCIAWRSLYGTWLLYTYQGEGFDWLRPHLFEVLFSPFHGLFNWHPVMLVGFLGLAGWAVLARRRTEAICFGLSLLLMIYVNGAWQCWWFGDSFGSRAFESCTFLAMLGLGFLLRMLSRWPVAFHATALALLIAGLWNMNLLWLCERGTLSVHDPVTWRERADLTWRTWVHP